MEEDPLKHKHTKKSLSTLSNKELKDEMEELGKKMQELGRQMGELGNEMQRRGVR
jgi:Tfp pilus assembly protein PilO